MKVNSIYLDGYKHFYTKMSCKITDEIYYIYMRIYYKI